MKFLIYASTLVVAGNLFTRGHYAYGVCALVVGAIAAAFADAHKK